MDNLFDCLNDIVKLNTIYTIVLIATATDVEFNEVQVKTLFTETTSTFNYYYYYYLYHGHNMNFNTSTSTIYSSSLLQNANLERPSLTIRIFNRLLLLLDNLVVYISNRFNEHTATSIASFSVLIIVLLIICCIIMSLMREEERKIKEQYKKLSRGSSQSFLANGSLASTTSNSNDANYSSHSNGNSYIASDLISGCGLTGSQSKSHAGYHRIANSCNQQPTGIGNTYFTSTGIFKGPPMWSSNNLGHPTYKDSSSNQISVIELRRETYFGLVRLLKPTCRTIVLLCDAQSRIKLLTKFFHCIYPYRKDKRLQFAFLLIEKNVCWYEDILKLALNEKRDLHINPMNCIGTVLVINGFKKYFSIYHASDRKFDPIEPFLLLEESLLDHLPEWLKRLFENRVSRYYVKYWPAKMR